MATTNPETLSKLAHAAHRRGDVKEARRLCQLIIDQHHESQEAENARLYLAANLQRTAAEAEKASGDARIDVAARLFLGIGTLVTLAAFIWWANFYGVVAKEILGGDTYDYFGCLYSSSGRCGFASGLAEFGGANPYNPAIFWMGIASLGIGIVLSLSVKKKESASG